MYYNKIKRILSLISGIVLLATMPTSILFGLALGSIYDTTAAMDGMYIMGPVCAVLFLPAMIPFGVKLIKKPVQRGNRLLNHLGARIAAMILLGILMMIVFVVCASYFTTASASSEYDGYEYSSQYYDYTAVAYVQMLLLFMYAQAFILILVSTIVRENVIADTRPSVLLQNQNYVRPVGTSAPVTAPVASGSEPETKRDESITNMETKVKTLTSWKEQGVINQEQYDAAINKLMDQLTEQ